MLNTTQKMKPKKSFLTVVRPLAVWQLPYQLRGPAPKGSHTKACFAASFMTVGYLRSKEKSWCGYHAYLACPALKRQELFRFWPVVRVAAQGLDWNYNAGLKRQ